MDQPKIHADDRMRWRMLAYLSITLVFAWATWFSATAVMIPQLGDIWALSPSAAAWLTIAVQVGFVVGAVISSLFNIADIIPPRYVIMVGAMGAATANALLLVADGSNYGITLRFATGFFLAGVYPPSFKLLSTWFRENRGLALGILAAAIVVGGGIPHLINGLGGLDWRVAISVTSLQALTAGLIAVFLIKEGPYPFPKAIADLRQIGLALANRGVRLATKPRKAKPAARKRGRAAKGEHREPRPVTRLERQVGQSASEALQELPVVCDVGAKKNSKGYKETWIGYKLHADTNDCGLPASVVLTSASVHDSQSCHTTDQDDK